MSREKDHGLGQMREHVGNLAKTVHGQRAQVRGAQHRYADHNARVGVLEVEIKNLKVATASATSDFENVQQYRKQVDRSLAEIREMLEDATRQEHDILRTIEQVKSRMLIAQRISGKTDSLLDSKAISVDSQNQLIAGIEDQIRIAEADLEQISARSARLFDEKMALEDLIRETKSSITAIDSEVKTSNSQHSAVDIGLRRRYGTLRSIRAVVNESVQKERDFDIELSGLAKSIRSGEEELEKQMIELTQRRDVQKPDLLRRIETCEQNISTTVNDTEALEKAIKAVETEHSSIITEIEGEVDARMKLQREFSVTQKQLDRKREECIKLASEKDSANIELNELMKEFNKYSTYLVLRDQQVAISADKRDKIRKDRTTAEDRLSSARLELENLESDLRLKQESETRLSASVAKLTKLSESILRKINDQRRIRDLKAERIKEAEMKQQSSEYSLSLSGKIQGIEAEIAKTINSCDDLEKSLTTTRQRVLDLSVVVSDQESHLCFIRNIITVRENQQRRLLSQVNSARKNIGTKQKELERLRFDLDNIGTIIVRFNEQKSTLDSDIRKIESKVGENVHAIKLRDLNDQLRADAVRLQSEFSTLNEERVELEKVTEVEISVQKSLIGTSSNDISEIKRTINQMLSHARELNKKKELAKANLVRMVEKRDIVELRRQSSSLRRSNGMSGLTSCSTVASLTSVPSMHGFDRQSVLEQRVIQYVLEGSKSRNISKTYMDGLEVELAALRAHLALMPKLAYKDRILDWIEFNWKLLSWLLWSCWLQ